jgi:hypothetical protein
MLPANRAGGGSAPQNARLARVIVLAGLGHNVPHALVADHTSPIVGNVVACRFVFSQFRGVLGDEPEDLRRGRGGIGDYE